MSSKRGVAFLKNVVDYCMKHSGYDVILKPFQVTGGGDGRCVGEFTVAKEHLNIYKALHGGFTASLMDNAVAYALMSADAHPGVSVDFYINYMKSAKEGDVVVLEATTTKVGNKLAYMECVLKDKSDGSIIAKGGQTRYVDLPKGKWSALYD